MFAHSFTASVLALAAALSLPAQRVVGDADTARKASTVVVASDTHETRAAVSISYSQPVWRENYDAMMDHITGNYIRLGNGWWTTFDTIGVLEIAGVRVEPGSYFVGLAVGPDAAFSLLLFDSRKTMQAGVLPASSALYRGEVKPDVKTPLVFAKGSLADTVPKLEIDITNSAKDPAAARLSLRWGKHELSAPVTLHLAKPAEDRGGK